MQRNGAWAPYPPMSSGGNPRSRGTQPRRYTKPVLQLAGSGAAVGWYPSPVLSQASNSQTARRLSSGMKARPRAGAGCQGVTTRRVVVQHQVPHGELSSVPSQYLRLRGLEA